MSDEPKLNEKNHQNPFGGSDSFDDGLGGDDEPEITYEPPEISYEPKPVLQVCLNIFLSII